MNKCPPPSLVREGNKKSLTVEGMTDWDGYREDSPTSDENTRLLFPSEMISRVQREEMIVLNIFQNRTNSFK